MFTQKLKHFAIALSLALSTGLVAAPALASAASQFKGDACSGLQQVDSGGCSDKSSATLNNILRTVINILSVVVGFVAVVMIMVGGFRYITSGGDSAKTASARSTIVYALIGIVIAMLAQVLVHFVLVKASGK